ncbi:hypothetical protein [Pseudorhizobium endolithicum]|uniref:hypothetical protein n=1 Tax=Pseudorhizobium endolithicum TaxID=1191678 RepID=UPI0011575DE4|nr:hypothetical protein [Pseudorhizobium endolithicum]
MHLDLKKLLVGTLLFILPLQATAADLWTTRTNEVSGLFGQLPIFTPFAGIECGELSNVAGTEPTEGCSFFLPGDRDVLLFALDFNSDGITDAVDLFCMTGCDLPEFWDLCDRVVAFATDTKDDTVLRLVREKGYLSLPGIVLMTGEGTDRIAASLKLWKPRSE